MRLRWRPFRDRNPALILGDTLAPKRVPDEYIALMQPSAQSTVRGQCGCRDIAANRRSRRKQEVQVPDPQVVIAQATNLQPEPQPGSARPRRTSKSSAGCARRKATKATAQTESASTPNRLQTPPIDCNAARQGQHQRKNRRSSSGKRSSQQDGRADWHEEVERQPPVGPEGWKNSERQRARRRTEAGEAALLPKSRCTAALRRLRTRCVRRKLEDQARAAPAARAALQTEKARRDANRRAPVREARRSGRACFRAKTEWPIASKARNLPEILVMRQRELETASRSWSLKAELEEKRPRLSQQKASLTKSAPLNSRRPTAKHAEDRAAAEAASSGEVKPSVIVLPGSPGAAGQTDRHDETATALTKRLRPCRWRRDRWKIAMPIPVGNADSASGDSSSKPGSQQKEVARAAGADDGTGSQSRAAQRKRSAEAEAEA